MQKQKLAVLVAGFALWGAGLNGMTKKRFFDDESLFAARRQTMAQREKIPAITKEVPVILEVEVNLDGTLRRVVGVQLVDSKQMCVLEAQKNSWNTVGQLFSHGIVMTARGTVMIFMLLGPLAVETLCSGAAFAKEEIINVMGGMRQCLGIKA